MLNFLWRSTKRLCITSCFCFESTCKKNFPTITLIHFINLLYNIICLWSGGSELYDSAYVNYAGVCRDIWSMSGIWRHTSHSLVSYSMVCSFFHVMPSHLTLTCLTPLVCHCGLASCSCAKFKLWLPYVCYYMITSQPFGVAPVPGDWWLQPDELLRRLRPLCFHNDSLTIFIQAIVKKWKCMHRVVAHWLANSLTDCWSCWADLSKSS